MDEFYTINQTAIILKVHQLTIRRYVKEGRLKAVRVGGNIRIPVDDLKDFIQGFAPHPKTQTPNASIKKSFSFDDPFFRLKAIGIAMSKVDLE